MLLFGHQINCKLDCDKPFYKLNIQLLTTIALKTIACFLFNCLSLLKSFPSRFSNNPSNLTKMAHKTLLSGRIPKNRNRQIKKAFCSHIHWQSLRIIRVWSKTILIRSQTIRYYTPEGTLRRSGSKIVGVTWRTLQFFWSVECWSGPKKSIHSEEHSTHCVIFQKMKCSA